ncbi:MAG: hypothetical protein ACJA0I_001089, partial [Gammaproteobacteria bacterium]
KLLTMLVNSDRLRYQGGQNATMLFLNKLK